MSSAARRASRLREWMIATQAASSTGSATSRIVFTSLYLFRETHCRGVLPREPGSTRRHGGMARSTGDSPQCRQSR